MSEFSRLYRRKRPFNPEKGGYDGRFESDLGLCVGFGIDEEPNDSNSCLARREGGLLVWSDRTVAKLEGSSGQGSISNQSNNIIENGIPFGNILVPINTSSNGDG